MNIFRKVLSHLVTLAVGVFSTYYTEIFKAYGFSSVIILQICVSILIFVAIFLSIMYSEKVNSNIISKSKENKELLEEIKKGFNTKFVPVDTAHKTLANWIQNAEKKIEVSSCYLYNWEQNKNNYNKTIAQSLARKESFKELQNFIKKAGSDENLTYNRIVQISGNYGNLQTDIFKEAVLNNDLLYKKEFETIHKYKNENNHISLSLAPRLWNSTFYLIDRKRLVIFLDHAIVNENKELEYKEPFCLLIESSMNEGLLEVITFFKKLRDYSSPVLDIESYFKQISVDQREYTDSIIYN